MLQHLKIRNLALLHEVELEFGEGFTAVTGETGAGKSVLLGALGLLSGARTDKALIRQGADALEVEAALHFGQPQAIDAVLGDQGLPPCDDGVLLLRRTIHRTKMPRIQVNGSMATLTQLQALGEQWIDFHGPGEPQKLFQESRQLEMLDAFADQTGTVATWRGHFRDWRAACEEVEKLARAERLDADEIEFIRKQVERIDRADPGVTSIEALERDFSRMSQAQELIALAAACADGINGETGMVEQLGTLVQRFEALAGIDEGSASLLERIRSLMIELQDLGDETGRLASDFDFDEETVQEVTERMTLWQDVRRKFGGTVEAVLAKRGELAAKLEMQGDIEGVIAKKTVEAAKQEAALRTKAAKIRQARTAAAKTLADRAAALLGALGFKKARLSIDVLPEKELQPHGDCRCRFLFAPNAGQDLMPLNKIASSGETARVMLALKTILAEADATPLLVFDEVDANVGGEVGRSVGKELARLSGRHQVLCVTHLPQVASLAHNHFTVTKDEADGRTDVSITSIQENEEDRIGEIARMLGDRGSASARKHAAELLAG